VQSSVDATDLGLAIFPGELADQVSGIVNNQLLKSQLCKKIGPTAKSQLVNNCRPVIQKKLQLLKN
jgi:hypothetical protein